MTKEGAAAVRVRLVDRLQHINQVAIGFALALVALVVVFKLIRPALNAALQPAGALPAPGGPLGRQLDVVADNELAMTASPVPTVPVPALTGPQTTARLDSARAFAQQNPAAVAQIVKDLVDGGPA